jgi:DNA-binding MarR family transcriptional regulator
MTKAELKPERSRTEDQSRLRLQNFVPYLLSVLARGISSSLAKKYAREFGISIPEWRVIAHLSEVRDASSGEICQRTAMDKATVNRAVTRLVAIGLVLAETQKRDRRLNSLALSAKGQSVYKRIVPIALEHEALVLEALSAQERAYLTRIVGKLLGRVREMQMSNEASED